MPAAHAGRLPVRLIAALLGLLLGLFAGAAGAHEIPTDARIQLYLKPGGGKLEALVRAPLDALRDIDPPLRGEFVIVSKADRAIRHAAQIRVADQIEMRADGRALGAARIVAARIALASDRAFARGFAAARAGVLAAPLADDLDLVWRQQWLDVLLEWDLADDRAALSVHPRFDRLAQRVATTLRFLPAQGGERAFQLHGDPGPVTLDRGPLQTAARFLAEGVRHILIGLDHLLFLACLVIPFRRWRPLVVIVTAFTLGHSLSLAAAATGFAPDAGWFAPLVETAIAASILYMAIENVLGASLSRRWGLALGFGLVHGFGFAFALREELQFAGEHLVVALFFFNVGVEIGQLLALAAMLAGLSLFFRLVAREFLGVALLSALAGHAAWHWMVERGADLMKLPPPAFDAALLAGLLEAAMAGLAVAGLAFALRGAVGRWMGAPAPARQR